MASQQAGCGFDSSLSVWQLVQDGPHLHPKKKSVGGWIDGWVDGTGGKGYEKVSDKQHHPVATSPTTYKPV